MCKVSKLRDCRAECLRLRAGHVPTMMEDEWAHVALLSAATHVDDTALLAKTLLPAIVVCLMCAHVPMC